MSDGKFTSALGCSVAVRSAPPSLGSGVLLSLHMEQPEDRRFAEVYLNESDISALLTLLLKRDKS